MATSMLAEKLGLKPRDFDEMFKSLGIKSVNHDDFKMVMTSEEWDDSDRIRDAVRYMGFDAKLIISQFYSKAAENPIDLKDAKTVSCGSAKLYEKNEPKSDLLFFLSVFLERGNNINKAITKCDATAVAALRRKAGAYGISMDAKKNKDLLGSKDLTLARLAQAFSVCTACLIISKNIPGKLTPKLFDSLDHLILQHTVFPGLIPGSAEYSDDLRSIAIILNMETSILLADQREKRKIALRSVDELMEASAQFVDAAMNGSAVSDSIKAKVLIKAGVLKVLEANRVGVSDHIKVLTERAAVIASKGRYTYTEMVRYLRDHSGAGSAERVEITDVPSAAGPSTPNE